MRINNKGFTAIEVIIVILIVGLLITLCTYSFGRISTQKAVSDDAVTSENLEKTRSKLVKAVTEGKAIPKDMVTEHAISYRRVDNQKAELCASFAAPRSGKNDSFLSPVDLYKKYFGSTSTTHEVYRDNLDFFKHGTGRNCYTINYAPINVAYEDKYKGDDKNWAYCDAYRQYDGKFTGQTIKGFVIGGPFTTNPGTAGGRAVLGADVDAYDENCVKIPISDLKVGDKVEFAVEKGPTNGGETVYFVKVIQKTF